MYFLDHGFLSLHLIFFRKKNENNNGKELTYSKALFLLHFTCSAYVILLTAWYETNYNVLKMESIKFIERKWLVHTTSKYLNPCYPTLTPTMPSIFEVTSKANLTEQLNSSWSQKSCSELILPLISTWTNYLFCLSAWIVATVACLPRIHSFHTTFSILTELIIALYPYLPHMDMCFKENWPHPQPPGVKLNFVSYLQWQINIHSLHSQCSPPTPEPYHFTPWIQPQLLMHYPWIYTIILPIHPAHHIQNRIIKIHYSPHQYP